MSFIDRMRAEWNQRAQQDAHFYVAFARQQQDEASFRASAAETMPALVQEFPRLAETDPARRKALEIGCGPGRLMAPMTEFFGEVHGVDISPEMIELARTRLAHLPGARLHVVSGADLAPLEDNTFDYVYSYTVFQHIPSRDAVMSYLREAHRVLKPGGILRCQIRGTKAPPSTLKNMTDTWTGCFFTAQEMIEFARVERFPLVEISGIGTQYMWTTFQKIPANAAQRDRLAAELRGVTSADGGATIPLRGPGAAVSLWIANFPGDGDLANFPVYFNGVAQMGCYLSPISDEGACQLNVRLPEGLSPGSVKVQLSYAGRPFGAIYDIEVTPEPATAPKILKVSDAINLTMIDCVESGGAKLWIEHLPQPESLVILVDGRKLTSMEYELRDPVTDTYEFSTIFPRKTKIGRSQITIQIAGKPFTQFDLEVVGTWD